VSLRFLPAAGRHPSPWKNGGGSTTEIAVFPAAAGLDDFDWRVSMAEVAASGPFSAFEGIDRTLCLLSGAGVTLRVGDREVGLGAASHVCRFPGDVATASELHDGPIADLNVMSRRGRFTHCLERFRLVGRAELASAPFTLVMAREGGLHVASGAVDLVLAAGDAALLEGAPGRITAPAPAEAFVVRFDRA